MILKFMELTMKNMSKKGVIDMMFVRMLPPAERLEVFKQVKGLCLWEGYNLVDTMKEVLDNKVKDVLPIVDYEMSVNYLEVYKDYSYGR